MCYAEEVMFSGRQPGACCGSSRQDERGPANAAQIVKKKTGLGEGRGRFKTTSSDTTVRIADREKKKALKS